MIFATIFIAQCLSEPTAPTDGHYSACSGSPAGTSCLLTCNPGTTQSGDNPQCDGTLWVGNPSCVGNPCALAPSPPAHGHTDACAGYPSGQTCNAMTCDVHYVAAGSGPVCFKGAWSGGSLACTAIVCDASPTAPSGGTYANCAATPQGNACALTCDPGYTKHGSDPTCDAGTGWLGTPGCDPNGCTLAPSAPAHGSNGGCANAPHGTLCPAICDAGYLHHGSAPQCDRGAWTSGGVESCDLNSCTVAPSNPDHGAASSCVGTVYGVTCAVTCESGYSATGPAQMCTAGGWTGDAQQCGPSACAVGPTSPTHGQYSSCDGAHSGSGCVLECEGGFHKRGNDASCALGAWAASGRCDATCANDAECPEGFCDPSTHGCVACLSDEDCADGHCHPTEMTCVGCLTDNDCTHQTCATTTLTCVSGAQQPIPSGDDPDDADTMPATPGRGCGGCNGGGAPVWLLLALCVMRFRKAVRS